METRQSLFDSLEFALQGADESLKKLKTLDPNFDAGDKINVGLSRALGALEAENEMLDLTQLKFSNYNLIKKSNIKNGAVFISKEKDFILKVFYPTEVSITNISKNEEKNVLVVIKEGINNTTHKSLVFDLVDKNLKFLSAYIEERLKNA